MNQISMIAMHAAASEAHDQSLTLISLFSCVGLTAALMLMTLGIDLSPAWV